jgi:hypothetical protein
MLNYIELETLTLRFISKSLNTNNSVDSLEYYPSFPEKSEKGWHFTYPSPFIHVNVIFSLMKSSNADAKQLVATMTPFLLQSMEKGNVWRFWSLKNCEHPVPPDIDDTALCSLVLKKMGFSVDNKWLFLVCLDSNARVLTWIKAKPKLFSLKPSLFYQLKRNEKKVRKTKQAGMFDWKDSELSVSINALMYLQKIGGIQDCIQRFIGDWKTNSSIGQYYQNEILLFYHIARAFREGLSELIELKNEILCKVKNSYHQYSFPELLLASITICYFSGDKLLLEFINEKVEQNIVSTKHNWEIYPYFSSKDGVFYAGSPILTSSWLIEYIYANKFIK